MEPEQDSTPARHVPVLLQEVLDALDPQPGGRYLDGTLGLGGHAEAVMERAGEGARLLGLDRDAEALALAAERLAPFGDRVSLAQSSYSRFGSVLDELGWDRVDGVLLDLGVSSLQLDGAERGFSFLRDGPLDMRMGTAFGAAPASSLVNKGSYERLKRVIARYGEEPLAGRITRAIMDARREAPIETTSRLAAIVERAYPAKMRAKARNHPATRTFQALRMEVNQELEELERFLGEIPARMRAGGRIVIISFHSLEDRIVKRAFRAEAKGCVCPPRQPVCTCGRLPRLEILTKKPVTPAEAEMEANPRARSAKMRAARRRGDEPSGDPRLGDTGVRP